MNHKLIKFTAVILAGFVVFLLGFVLTRKTVENQQALINNSLVARFDQQAEKRTEPSGIFQISRDKAAFATLMNGGKEIWYYNSDNGEVRSVATSNLAGGSTLVVKIRPGANSISWGQNKTSVAQYAIGSVLYDLNSNYSKKYDITLKNPVLNPSGDKVAYNYFNEKSGEGAISIADPKTEHFKNVLPTRFESWQLRWVNDDILALVKPPTLDNVDSSLFMLDIKSGDLQVLLETRNSLETRWSPNGSRVLYSYADNVSAGTNLYFADRSIRKEMPLGIVGDASRCVWSIDNKTVYCVTDEGLVRFDVLASKTTLQNIVAGLPTDQVASLLLTSSEDYLIFQDSKTGRISGIKIN